MKEVIEILENIENEIHRKKIALIFIKELCVNIQNCNRIWLTFWYGGSGKKALEHLENIKKLEKFIY